MQNLLKLEKLHCTSRPLVLLRILRVKKLTLHRHTLAIEERKAQIGFTDLRDFYVKPIYYECVLFYLQDILEQVWANFSTQGPY